MEYFMKMKKQKINHTVKFLLLILAFTITACGGGGGGGGPQTATYTGVFSGTTYTLKITEKTERYTARSGDDYELTNGSKKSAGTVQSVSGNVLTLKPSNASATFTATVSGSSLTALNGTITWTDNTTSPAPGTSTGGGSVLSGNITISPTDNVTTGTELTANYSGIESVTYQWKRGDTNIGENSNKYTPSEAGSYTVTVSAAGYQSKTSPAVTVTGDTLLSLTGDITISPDSGVEPGMELTANYSGNESVTYQWKRGDTNVGTNAKYTPTTAGSYTVTVSAAGYQSKTSAAVTVTGETIFTSIYEFRRWLNAQPANTADTAYTVKLNVNDLGGTADTAGSLGKALKDNDTKYVNLDLSGSTITSIGNYAFSGCIGLTSVIIGNSVTSIGEVAFYRCTSLTSITIPDSVTSIEYSAFSGCDSLASVIIGNNVTTIRANAFSGCDSLTSITIGNSVTTIGESAFSYCTNLRNITIKTDKVTNTVNKDGSVVDNWLKRFPAANLAVTFEDVTSIGDYAFYYPSNHSNADRLTSVTIGNSVTSIGESAFSGCIGLTSVTIGNSVTTIGEYAFYRCTSLTSITIPDSVTSIGYGAFSNCTDLTEITIPDSVTSIGYDAFYRCNLTSVVIGNGVTNLNGFKFDNTKLTSITIGNSVTTIGYGAFSGCTGLTGVTIPDSVTTIGERAFYNCTGLTGVTIPDSVTSIGESAFNYCTNLTSVTIGNSVTSIGTDAFKGCTNLKNITIKTDKVTNTDSNNWLTRFPATGLSVTFEDVTSIGNYAFCPNITSDETRLTSVTIPDSVISIGSGAFGGCTSLTSVTIPDSVTTIGERAFSGCDSLTSATIGNKVTTIGEYAFWYCTSLISVTIPDSVTTIGNYAFYGCTSLTSATIGNKVTTIGEYAFSGCTSLTSATIGNSVASIRYGAFSDCTSLTNVTFLGTNIVIDNYNYVFRGDLYDKYLAGGIGTYTTTAPVSYDSVWTKK
jgi:hypothetical protein